MRRGHNGVTDGLQLKSILCTPSLQAAAILENGGPVFWGVSQLGPRLWRPKGEREGHLSALTRQLTPSAVREAEPKLFCGAPGFDPELFSCREVK